MTSSTKYPGGSRRRIDKAGDRVRSGTATKDDERVIEEWRSAHRHVLNTFQAILRNRTKATSTIVAQRHKRKNTIYGKLYRHQKMALSRMDDIAGCRLIFRTTQELYEFREVFHKARFNHKRVNPPEKYDYILNPKQTGYRGIHDIYRYNVNSPQGKHLTGLQVEIQYRTLVQHAWATAVEVIGFVTESQPKFQQGDVRYERAMALASEILARAHEGEKGPFPGMTDREALEQFLDLDRDLALLKTLKGLNKAKQSITDERNVILIFSTEGKLETITFRNATDALRSLFTLEKQHPDTDIVLVRADSSSDVRQAFRNYFSDARDFVRLINAAVSSLSSARRQPQERRKVI